MDRNDASDAFAACLRVSLVIDDDDVAAAESILDSLAAPHVADAQQLLEEFVHGGIVVQVKLIDRLVSCGR